MNFRLLTHHDSEHYRALRLHALHELPGHFASSFEIEKQKSIEEIIEEISPSASSFFMGAFNDTLLVGIAGFKQEPLEKMKHRGQILGMYISPSMRGRGLGKKLLTALISKINENTAIERVDLAVSIDNAKAITLYESLGFDTYGKYKRALKLDNGYVDEAYMALDLNR